MIESTVWFLLGGISYFLFFLFVEYIVKKIDNKRDTTDSVEISLNKEVNTLSFKLKKCYTKSGKEKCSASFSLSGDDYAEFITNFKKEIGE